MSTIGKITCVLVIKEANSVALSTTEAEYILAGSCCAQLLQIKATLSDFEIKFKQVPLLCDNESAIKLTNNPVQHSRTKHIDVRHHFIRDHQQKEDICIESVGTEDQLADISTKPISSPSYSTISPLSLQYSHFGLAQLGPSAGSHNDAPLPFSVLRSSFLHTFFMP